MAEGGLNTGVPGCGAARGRIPGLAYVCGLIADLRLASAEGEPSLRGERGNHGPELSDPETVAV